MFCKRNKKIERTRKNKSYIEKLENKLYAQIDKAKMNRDLSRTWIHVDMDMFYAAVEILDNPTLGDKPIAVGDYSMITTANYIARKFGVRSAMPGFIGKQLGQDLLIVKPNVKRYAEISKVFKDILSEYDSHLESIGLDEGNLDVTDYLISHDMNTLEGREELATIIRSRIFEATKLTGSAGVSGNKMLAKICSDQNKPDGHYILPHDNNKIEEFMSELNIRKIPGIGGVNEGELNRLGISKGKDILDNIVDIYISNSERLTYFLMNSAIGISRNTHEIITENSHQKSFSVSETFSPIKEKGQFIEMIENLAERLEKKLKENKGMGKIIGLEFKDVRFNSKIKSKSLAVPISNKEDILKFALKILDENWPYEKVRLLGLSLSDIVKEDKVLKFENINKFFK